MAAAMPSADPGLRSARFGAARVYSERAQKLALANGAVSACASVACNASERREIDMGREIRFSRRVENASLLVPGHGLQRVAVAAAFVTVVDEECGAAVSGDGAACFFHSPCDAGEIS